MAAYLRTNSQNADKASRDRAAYLYLSSFLCLRTYLCRFPCPCARPFKVGRRGSGARSGRAVGSFSAPARGRRSRRRCRIIRSTMNVSVELPRPEPLWYLEIWGLTPPSLFRRTGGIRF
jgi:hypothetical protein